MSTFRTVRMDASLDECYVAARPSATPTSELTRNGRRDPASTVLIPTMAAMHHPREIRLAIAMAPSTMTRMMAAGVSHASPGASPRR
jgi:hypothetical protein